MLLRAGEKVGQYEIISELGRGGMATVYKANHKQLDRQVAIKVMHQSFADDPSFTERFNREARIVANLEHPHIVPVYDYNEHHGMPYLVMKFVQGRSLKELLIKKPPTLDQIMHIMAAIGQATTYAHKKGVLHRDIKPSNIIIDNENIPYLADFGLARIVAAGESTMSADVLLGTPNYMSPEQGKGIKDIDHRSDLYSLGIVLYELVVGQVPFSAQTPLAVIQDHINTPLPRPSQINTNVPPEIEAVLRKALAKSPDARYNSANEMIAEFTIAVEAEGLKELADNRQEIADDSLGRWRSAYIKHSENQNESSQTDDDLDSLAGPIRNLAAPSIIKDTPEDNLHQSDTETPPSALIEQPKPKNQPITTTLVRHEPNSRYWKLAGAGIIILSLFLIVAVILNASNTFLEIAEILQDIDANAEMQSADPTGLLLDVPLIPIDEAEELANNEPEKPINYLILARSQYEAGAIDSARDSLNTGYNITDEVAVYLANAVSIADTADDPAGAMIYGVLLWELTYNSVDEQLQLAHTTVTEYLYNQSVVLENIPITRSNYESLRAFLSEEDLQAIIRSQITRILIANNHIEQQRNRFANVAFQSWNNETYALAVGQLVSARHNILEGDTISATNQLNQMVETSTTPAWIVTITTDLLITIEE